MKKFGWRSAVAAIALAGASPASAERVFTFWRLAPVSAEMPSEARFGQPFLEQKLLPVRMVKLDEPVRTEKGELAAGTYLYLVFNAAGKIGYCTVKDRSLGHQAKTLFIPIMDQRPCLVDSDGDGRFDRVFLAYDAYGGTPQARGSINGAKPLAAMPRYSVTDLTAFPNDLRVSFELVGKKDVAKARIGIRFSRSVGGDWVEQRGKPKESGQTFDLLNAHVDLLSVDGETARISAYTDEEMFIFSDTNTNIYTSALPPFIPR